MDSLYQEQLRRLEFKGRHLRKRIRKFQRRVGPLIRRLERATKRLQETSR